MKSNAVFLLILLASPLASAADTVNCSGHMRTAGTKDMVELPSVNQAIDSHKSSSVLLPSPMGVRSQLDLTYNAKTEGYDYTLTVFYQTPSLPLHTLGGEMVKNGAAVTFQFMSSKNDIPVVTGMSFSEYDFKCDLK